jgi:hypothetical protein
MGSDYATQHVSNNGKQRPPRPRIEVRRGAASPEEAAAIAAAIEQFLRDTAPDPVPAEGMSPWLRAGLYEGTGRDPMEAVPHQRG